MAWITALRSRRSNFVPATIRLIEDLLSKSILLRHRPAKNPDLLRAPSPHRPACAGAMLGRTGRERDGFVRGRLHRAPNRPAPTFALVRYRRRRMRLGALVGRPLPAKRIRRAPLNLRNRDPQTKTVGVQPQWRMEPPM